MAKLKIDRYGDLLCPWETTTTGNNSLKWDASQLRICYLLRICLNVKPYLQLLHGGSWSQEQHFSRIMIQPSLMPSPLLTSWCYTHTPIHISQHRSANNPLRVTILTKWLEILWASFFQNFEGRSINVAGLRGGMFGIPEKHLRLLQKGSLSL